VPHHLDERPVLHSQLLQAQDLRKSAIRVKHPLALADHRHAFDHALQDGRFAIALIAEHANGLRQPRGGGVERARQIVQFVPAPFRFQWPEIPARHAVRKLLQPPDPPRKPPSGPQRNAPGERHHRQRHHPVPAVPGQQQRQQQQRQRQPRPPHQADAHQLSYPSATF
jgi:hypothetical protein